MKNKDHFRMEMKRITYNSNFDIFKVKRSAFASLLSIKVDTAFEFKRKLILGNVFLLLLLAVDLFYTKLRND